MNNIVKSEQCTDQKMEEINSMDSQETPDINFSEIISSNDVVDETPNIEFTEEIPNAIDETEIDDLDEPDQYVEDEPNRANDEDSDADVDDESKGLHSIIAFRLFMINFESLSSGAEKEQRKGSNENRLIKLPLARIKNIMKVDPDVTLITSESAFLVTRATELFIESLARESFLYTSQAKKKTVQKRDVDMAISNVDALMFLEGAMNF